MWLAGEVMQAKPGFEGNRETGDPDVTTLFLAGRQDGQQVVCPRAFLPENLEFLIGRFIILDARLRELAIPLHPGPLPLPEVYEAIPDFGRIRFIDPLTVQALRLGRQPGPRP